MPWYCFELTPEKAAFGFVNIISAETAKTWMNRTRKDSNFSSACPCSTISPNKLPASALYTPHRATIRFKRLGNPGG